ncbi:MAG: hypothetical protein IT580_00770 [Verrucomicrobiales bacterium]|nr:hypothetical protein [Verrucomicrobiales bacterium]
MADEFHQESSETGADPGPHAPSTFWYLVVVWALFYLTVVVAWGQRNSWPSALVLCVLSMPVTLFVVSTIFQINGFTTAIDTSKSQQEQLIAALVLAVGLASGQLLLMTLGLVCLGVAWLRPATPGIDWAEWLKIPLLFFSALPFWLDFEGSRSPLARLFDHRLANPEIHLPLALTTTQAHLLGYCSLLGLALVVRGRAFWLSLPALPLFLAASCIWPRIIPSYATWPGLLRNTLPWAAAAVSLMLVARAARTLDTASRSIVSGNTLKRWFEDRLYPPWLAVLVVAVMQALPFETVRLSTSRLLGLGGTIVLLLLLAGLRLRTPKGPIHSRSVAMVAGGLALTLLAEFATYENLRHVAVVFVLVGLLSWRCFWPLRIFLAAGIVAILLLLLGAEAPLGVLASGPATLLRFALALLTLLVLAWWVQRPVLEPGALGYSDEGWIPPKRFALILLGLMMLFQMAAAFWPDHELRVPIADSPLTPGSPPTHPAAMGQAGWFRIPTTKGPVHVTIAHPRMNPYLLESPERTFRKQGWRVIRRERVQHPHGEAMSIVLERESARATALWWFEVGQNAFANHLYARRVLWSGWHLADRRMRLVQLESTSLVDPRELTAVAERENWLRNPGQLASLRP